MLRKYVPRLAALLTLVFAGTLVNAAPAPAVNELIDNWIVNWNSQKCIDDPHGTSSNVTMIQYECLFPEQQNQNWDFLPTDSGYYQIQNNQSGKCLTVLNASTAINVAVIQYECNGGTNAQWKTVFWVRASDDGGISRDWYKLVNRKSGLCLTVKNASTANSATLLQYTCNGGANAYWTWY